MVSAQAVFGRRAVQWALRAQDRLMRPPTSPDEGLAFLKRTGELALLANLLLRENAAELGFCRDDEAATLIERCWARLGEGEVICDAIVTHPRFVPLAAFYVPFFQRGMRHRGIEAIVARAACEQPRNLPLIATAEELKVGPQSAFDQLVERSWLYRGHRARPVNVADTYTITHIVFHLDDQRRLPENLRARLRLWTPRWIQQWIRAGNLDLVAELIMVAHCLDAGCVADEHWGALLESQGADGAVPSIIAGPADDASYHTTFVAAMAALFCARGERCDRDAQSTQ